MKTNGLLLFVLMSLPKLAFAQQEIAYDSTTDVRQFSTVGQPYDYRSNIRTNS